MTRPRLSTAAKVRLAGRLSAAVRAARSILGQRGTVVRCRRGGLEWELDLDEGVQLAIFALGAFERRTAAVLRSLVRRGSRVVDIGANIGAHALPLAAHVGPEGRVVAVEPTSHAFARLRRNADLNPGTAPALQLVQAMLLGPGQPPPPRLYASWPLTQDADVHPVHRGRSYDVQGVRTLTLDALVAETRLDRVDLIKLDVDGGEVGVLGGGRETLARLRPAIVLEVSPHQLRDGGSSVGALVSLLRESGYALHDESGAPLTMDPAALEALIPRGGSINAVARPC